MHVERSHAINNKIPLHPSISHCSYYETAFNSCSGAAEVPREAISTTRPQKKRKKGQRKLKVDQPKNLIHSLMIHSTVAVQSEIFMRLGGVWERMATAGSGGLFVKIIKGREKKAHLLGLTAMMESLCCKSAEECTVGHVYVGYKFDARRTYLCIFVDKPTYKALVKVL